MGLVHAVIQISNPLLPDAPPMDVKCLVDSGATYLCIPQRLADQLGLIVEQQKDAMLADGSWTRVPYAGPLRVSFENRICFTGAMVLGDECLLGAVPMEDMDLVIHPKLQKLAANPESPHIPRGMAKNLCLCYDTLRNHFRIVMG